ncbi:MAG: MFS transporter [Gammaproteobacteria bacterium]|nr:MFS transporter [Gammaproteobacteria bacterium]
MKTILNFSLLWRNPNFGFLYAGQLISFAGTVVTGVALPWQIYSLTHSTLMVGLLSLFRLLPLLVTALFGGVLADRHHRRMLLLISESSLIVGCMLLAWNASQGHPNLWIIFILATVMSGITGLHRPALDSLVQQIVAKKDYRTASALGSLKFNMCMIVAPALGGLLIAHAGLVAAYIMDGFSFALSLGSLLLMKNIPSPVVKEDLSAIASLRQGVRYAFSRQELFGSYIVDFTAMIFGMPNALFPAIAQSFGGVKTLGLLYSAPAIGALFASLFSGWARHVKRYGVVIAVSASLWGVAIICFGLSPYLWLALIFLGIAGILDDISGLFRMTLWNETIPNHLRGRLAGIEMISYLSGPRLGDTEASLVASLFGVTASIVSGGVLCVVGVVLCCVYLPQFWKFKSEEV